MSECPHSETWLRLLDETLADELECQLEQHLEVCLACRLGLEQRIAEQPVYSRLRGRLRSRSRRSAVTQSLQPLVDNFVREMSRRKASRTARPQDVVANDLSTGDSQVTETGRWKSQMLSWRLPLMAAAAIAIGGLALRLVSTDLPEPTHPGTANQSSARDSAQTIAALHRSRAAASVVAAELAAVVVQGLDAGPVGVTDLQAALQLVNEYLAKDPGAKRVVVTCQTPASVEIAALVVPSDCELTIAAGLPPSTRRTPVTNTAGRPDVTLVLKPDDENQTTGCRVQGRLTLADVALESLEAWQSPATQLIDVHGGNVRAERCRLICNSGSVLRLRGQASVVLDQCELHAGYNTVLSVASDSPEVVMHNCLTTGRTIFSLAVGRSATPLTLNVERSRFFGRELIQLVSASRETHPTEAPSDSLITLDMQSSTVAMPNVVSTEFLTFPANSSRNLTATIEQTRRLLCFNDAGSRFLRPWRLPDGLSGISVGDLKDAFPSRETQTRSIRYLPTGTQASPAAIANPHRLTGADFDWLSLPTDDES